MLMTLQHPFQKLCLIAKGPDRPPLLLAASGSTISIFRLRDNILINKFKFGDEEDSGNHLKVSLNGGNVDDEQRPTKRRKLEGVDENVDQDSDLSVEFVSERQKGQRRRPKVQNSKPPNVSHLLSTSNGQYIIAVTSEDKSVNVLELTSSGELILQSTRSMPKRLCAIALTSDEKSLLAGDKFGDVYWLPLIPSKEYVPKKVEDKITADPYQPSATELTVHTQGNLEALRQQRERKHLVPKKDGLNFEHKLLLGHVSLLTDVCITEVLNGSSRRQFILTADRDEHIRVSRGLSQAHVIENYCSGHRDFVSKLCILPWNHKILVAGSGEPSLRVYDWQSGQTLSEDLFSGVVQRDLSHVVRGESERSLNRLAVSGIWPFENKSASPEPFRLLLVALEGLPILFSYAISNDQNIRHHQTLMLNGNALDVVIDEEQSNVIVSIDTIHEPSSMKTIRSAETSRLSPFEIFSLSANQVEGLNPDPKATNGTTLHNPQWKQSMMAEALNSAIEEDVTGSTQDKQTPIDEASSKSTSTQFGEFLYGLENLRKKQNQTEGDEEKDEDKVETPVLE